MDSRTGTKYAVCNPDQWRLPWRLSDLAVRSFPPAESCLPRAGAPSNERPSAYKLRFLHSIHKLQLRALLTRVCLFIMNGHPHGFHSLVTNILAIAPLPRRPRLRPPPTEPELVSTPDRYFTHLQRCGMGQDPDFYPVVEHGDVEVLKQQNLKTRMFTQVSWYTAFRRQYLLKQSLQPSGAYHAKWLPRSPIAYL